MEERRFDQLARALGGASTRRGALAGMAGLAAGLGLAGQDAKAKNKKKRKKCDPQCAAGQTCRQGACVCDNGGAVCGATCCTSGQRCQDGQCVAPPEQCIAAGEACQNTGRVCCDGTVCASGQGGKGDVACWKPAGTACEATAECVYDSTCKDGVCVSNSQPQPEPQPEPDCVPAFPVTGDAAANGKALQDAVAAAASGATIVLAAGDYRFDEEMSEDYALRVLDKAISIERCAANAFVNLICPSDLDVAYCVGVRTDAGPAALSLKGVAVQSLRTSNPQVAVSAFATDYVGTLTLEDVTVSVNRNNSQPIKSESNLASVIVNSGVAIRTNVTNLQEVAMIAEASLGRATISCTAKPTYVGYPNGRCRVSGAANITFTACDCNV